ncbi:MAG TPA: nicotinate-nucleotide adenylyltransferase [Burkholderiales bacterium]
MQYAAPVGILGGTFDPIHFGHLRLAIEAAEICGLAEVRLIPAGTPPHRPPPVANARHRLEMASLATAGCPRLRVDEREAFKTAPCYTVETLAELRAQLGDAVPLCLIVGRDQYLDLAAWHRWRELFGLCHLVVAERPGVGARRKPEGPLAEEDSARTRDDPRVLCGRPAGAIVPIAITALDISASDIRARLAAGRSVRYLLPDPVLDYIRANSLYPGEG